MNRFSILFVSRLAILSIVGTLAGCSLQEDTLQQALEQAQKAASAQNRLANSFSLDGAPMDSDDSVVAGHFVDSQSSATTNPLDPLDAAEASEPSVPYPDRKNPFEFAEGSDFEAPLAKQNENLEIKLFGFVGTHPPKAIVNVGGRTKLLQAGEHWGVLEIMEVTPPTVRIKSNGVARVWSLLGHHQETAP